MYIYTHTPTENNTRSSCGKGGAIRVLKWKCWFRAWLHNGRSSKGGGGAVSCLGTC